MKNRTWSRRNAMKINIYFAIWRRTEPHKLRCQPRNCQLTEKENREQKNSYIYPVEKTTTLRRGEYNLTRAWSMRNSESCFFFFFFFFFAYFLLILYWKYILKILYIFLYLALWIFYELQPLLISKSLYIYIYIYIYIYNTPKSTNYTATCLPSRKPYKLDKPGMQDTAGEAETSR